MSAMEVVTKTFPIGKKKVFLPAHMVTLLAPRERQPPIFARFRVPLTFNKFDLRDYLLHVYKTPVVAVRSQLRQQPIKHSKIRARIYRPPPIKTMTVQLMKPFVWPHAPTNVTPWRSAAAKTIQDNTKVTYRQRSRLQKTGFMPLQDERKEASGRKELRLEAKRLLKEGGWTNKRDVDLKFDGKGDAIKSQATKSEATKDKATKDKASMKKSKKTGASKRKATVSKATVSKATVSKENKS